MGGMGNVFFARVGLRNYTGKSRCIPTLRRDTSGLTHATRILSCDTALTIVQRNRFVISLGFVLHGILTVLAFMIDVEFLQIQVMHVLSI